MYYYLYTLYSLSSVLYSMRLERTRQDYTFYYIRTCEKYFYFFRLFHIILKQKTDK